MQTAGPQRAALLWWFCIIKQRSQLLSWVKQQGPTESSRGIRAKWPGTVFGEGLGGPLELPASRAPFSPSYRRAALSEAVQPMTSLTRSRCAAREWMLGSASDESCLRHLPEDIEPSSYPVWDSVVFFFFFSENSAENTHFSLQAGRFDKLCDKFEHWKELLVDQQF